MKDWDVSGDGNFAILKKANDYDAFDNTVLNYTLSVLFFLIKTYNKTCQRAAVS